MRYDLISPRKRKDKTFWTRVGAAFPRDNGGFSLSFDALPLPDENGEVRVLMVEPRQDGQRQERQQSSGGGQGSTYDDEIPW